MKARPFLVISCIAISMLCIAGVEYLWWSYNHSPVEGMQICKSISPSGNGEAALLSTFSYTDTMTNLYVRDPYQGKKNFVDLGSVDDKDAGLYFSRAYWSGDGLLFIAESEECEVKDKSVTKIGYHFGTHEIVDEDKITKRLPLYGGVGKGACGIQGGVRYPLRWELKAFRQD